MNIKKSVRSRVPHKRGDEPAVKLNQRTKVLCSPHTWGWTVGNAIFSGWLTYLSYFTGCPPRYHRPGASIYTLFSQGVIHGPPIGTPAFKIWYPRLTFYDGWKANNCIAILAKTVMQTFLYHRWILIFSKRVKNWSVSPHLKIRLIHPPEEFPMNFFQHEHCLRF